MNGQVKTSNALRCVEKRNKVRKAPTRKPVTRYDAVSVTDIDLMLLVSLSSSSSTSCSGRGESRLIRHLGGIIKAAGTIGM